MKLLCIHTAEDKKVFINPETISGIVIGKFNNHDKYQIQFFLPNINMASEFYDSVELAEKFLIDNEVLPKK